MTRRCTLAIILFLAVTLSLTLNGEGRTPNIVPASKKLLRVMTYNIHVGVGMDKKLDLERIADVINRERPHLVALQEVDRGVRRTEGKDELAELAALTRMHSAFAHNLDYQGGQYGVAVLSRFPIRHIDHRKYENRREAERRGMLRVELDVDGKVLHFVSTHLDHQHADGRLFECEQLLGYLANISGPLIVAGDFNDEPSGGGCKLVLGRFSDAWLSGRAGSEGFTYPADKPVKRIDYIFTRPAERMKTKKAWIVNTLASDHLPVVADVEIGW